MDIRLNSYHNADSLARDKAGTPGAAEQVDLHTAQHDGLP